MAYTSYATWKAYSKGAAILMRCHNIPGFSGYAYLTHLTAYTTVVYRATHKVLVN